MNKLKQQLLEEFEEKFMVLNSGQLLSEQQFIEMSKRGGSQLKPKETINELKDFLSQTIDKVAEGREVKISKTEHSTGKEEWWCEWFVCPNCRTGGNEDYPSGHIYTDFKYCPDCGVELKWQK